MHVDWVSRMHASKWLAKLVVSVDDDEFLRIAVMMASTKHRMVTPMTPAELNRGSVLSQTRYRVQTTPWTSSAINPST